MSKNTLKIVATLVGTAIGYSAISIVSMPLAKAAVLTYNFSSSPGGNGFFKFSNSGITGIGVEETTVSDGRLDTILFIANPDYPINDPKSYDLAGAIALFDGGVFRGLQARGSDRFTKEFNLPDTGSGDSYRREEYNTTWYFNTTLWASVNQWTSSLQGGTDIYTYNRTALVTWSPRPYLMDGGDYSVTYTITDTAAEPVPEPMTVAGTALALVGFAGFKQRKKMAS